MKIWVSWFNTYLAVLLAGGVAGCSSSGKSPRRGGKEATTISFHWEMNPDGTERTVQVPIYRQNPTLLTVSRSPFLHEGFVERAEVVDVMGSFELRLQFDRSGTLMLENVSTSYRGRRVAIFSQFGEARWLGAPLLTRRISDGVFSFTPDATRAEAERIARGLNNVAAEWQKRKK